MRLNDTATAGVLLLLEVHHAVVNARLCGDCSYNRGRRMVGHVKTRGVIDE